MGIDLEGNWVLNKSRLSMSLRTALACIIVGITISPSIINEHFKFPAFSYMTAVVIVRDATLGDSIKCAICALYGSALGLIPSLLALWMIRENSSSYAVIAVVVLISSFVVVMFDMTALITKRIALCQIVIMCVTSFKEARHGRFVVDPVPVFASTAVGAVASVLALVFPYPRLAFYQVTDKNNLYTEMAMERLRLIINGIYADSTTCAYFWASQAKSFAVTSTKLLRNIKLVQVME